MCVPTEEGGRYALAPRICLLQAFAVVLRSRLDFSACLSQVTEQGDTSSYGRRQNRRQICYVTDF